MKKRGRILLIILLVPAVCLLILVISFRTQAAPSVPDRAEDLKKIIKETIARTSHSIVKISSEAGFFIRPDYLVTFYHAVQHGDVFSVITADGKTLKAEFFAADPVTDLAVLHIPGGSFYALKFASRRTLQPGLRVIAADPGQETSCILSGISGNMAMLDTVIPGNGSGWPLLNLRGEVLGLGLAANGKTVLSGAVVQDITDKLIQTGFVERPMLGILAADGADGVIIRAVARCSPAADSLDPGDVILKANDREIRSSAELRQIILQTGIGKEIFLEIRRKERTLSGGLTLQKSTRNWFRGLVENCKEPLTVL